MLVIGVWINAIGVIVKFLLAEGRLGVLGLAREEKVGVQDARVHRLRHISRARDNRVSKSHLYLSLFTEGAVSERFTVCRS